MKSATGGAAPQSLISSLTLEKDTRVEFHEPEPGHVLIVASSPSQEGLPNIGPSELVSNAALYTTMCGKKPPTELLDLDQRVQALDPNRSKTIAEKEQEEKKVGAIQAIEITNDGFQIRTRNGMDVSARTSMAPPVFEPEGNSRELDRAPGTTPPGLQCHWNSAYGFNVCLKDHRSPQEYFLWANGVSSIVYGKRGTTYHSIWSHGHSYYMFPCPEYSFSQITAGGPTANRTVKAWGGTLYDLQVVAW